MRFNENHQLIDFGIDEGGKEEIIKRAIPFMTSRCPNKNGNPTRYLVTGPMEIASQGII